jgi:hypothetical protein
MITVTFNQDYDPYTSGEVAQLPETLADQLVAEEIACRLDDTPTVAVKFVQDYDPYEPGHVVDLDARLAKKLIEDQICVPYRPSGAMQPLAPTVTTEEDPSHS